METLLNIRIGYKRGLSNDILGVKKTAGCAISHLVVVTVAKNETNKKWESSETGTTLEINLSK